MTDHKNMNSSGTTTIAWLKRLAADLRRQARNASRYADAWVGKPEDTDCTGIFARGEARALEQTADRLERRATRLERAARKGAR